MDNKKQIIYNLLFLELYKDKSKIEEYIKNENDVLFNILSMAYMEDIFIFFRILLYIANNRKNDVDEVFYKIIIQFIASMNSDVIMANIDIFLKNGKYADVLYYLQCPSLTKKINTYIKSKSNNNKIFKKLLKGKIPKEKIKRIKFKKTNTKDLLIEILDCVNFNGIIA